MYPIAGRVNLLRADWRLESVHLLSGTWFPWVVTLEFTKSVCWERYQLHI